MMKSKKAPKLIAASVVAVAFLGGIAFGVMVLNIRHSVRMKCADAQQAHSHPGDDVVALIEYINSDEHSFSERNSAIWTLGRLCWRL